MVQLNIRQCRKVLGADAPILVSDDRSSLSDAIQIICNRENVDYVCSNVTRGHFAGDVNCFLAGLVHAKVNGADACVKLSQRLIVIDQTLPRTFERYLKDADILIPGQPNAGMIRTDHRSFSAFKFLTDVVVMKVEAVAPEFIRDEYIHQVRTDTNPQATYVELLWSNLIEKRFKDRHKVITELTDHQPFAPYRYHRRYQNSEADYAALFKANGIEPDDIRLGGWKSILKHYRPAPQRL